MQTIAETGAHVTPRPTGRKEPAASQDNFARAIARRKEQYRIQNLALMRELKKLKREYHRGNAELNEIRSMVIKNREEQS